MSETRRHPPDRLGEPFEAVLSAAQSGAGWAAERLWTSLAPAVAGYLRVQGASEPDDLTSKVFLGVFRSLGPFSGSEEQLRSWVFTIAHRRLTDERRRAGRRPPASRLDELNEREDEPRMASASSAEHEALRQLRCEASGALRRITPDPIHGNNGEPGTYGAALTKSAPSEMTGSEVLLSGNLDGNWITDSWARGSRAASG